MDPAIRASKKMPPTVPPAMAPVLLWEEVAVLFVEIVAEVEEEVVAGEDD